MLFDDDSRERLDFAGIYKGVFGLIFLSGDKEQNKTVIEKMLNGDKRLAQLSSLSSTCMLMTLWLEKIGTKVVQYILVD